MRSVVPPARRIARPRPSAAGAPCLALVLALSAGGCCSGSGLGGGPGVTIGDQAPDFDLPGVAGSSSQRLSDHLGKVVLVNFWASWCGPCRMEMPELENLWLRFEGQDLVIIGVSIDSSARDAERLLEQGPVSYPVVWDEAGRAATAYRVMSVPRTVLIDRKGLVRARHDGFDRSIVVSLEGDIQALLEESP